MWYFRVLFGQELPTRLGMSWLGNGEIPATWKQRLVLMGKVCLSSHEL